MLRMAVGHSDDPETSEALTEVLEQCHEQLQGHQPQAGILLAALDFDHQALLDGILSVYPDLELIGCTTAGELSSELGYQQDSVVLNLFASDEVQFQAGVARNVSEDPMTVTSQTYQALCDSTPFEPKLCLIFPEAKKSVYFAVVETMATVADVPVLGGVAGGNPKTDETCQFYRNEIFSDSVPMLMMGGKLKVSHSYASGWQPFGKTGQVTKVKGNAIYEIDHQPPSNFYKHYFKTFSPDSAYPLAVFPPEEDASILRAAVALDPEQGHLFMGGHIPENSKVRITTTDDNSIIEAARISITDALREYPGQFPDAALLFSCAWRAWVLGTQTYQEFESFRMLPDFHLPCAGFYTFGEITPLRKGGPTFSHNTTFVTVLLGTQ